MTPAEASQERRDAAIRRSRRIDRLFAHELSGVLHRIAAFEPKAIDQALDEWEANYRTRMHPVRFKRSGAAITARCEVCPGWRVGLEDEHSLGDLQRLVAEHSGIEQ